MIAHRDVFPSDFPQEVEDFFSASGRLSHAHKFEYRRPQQEMAVAVAGALETQSHLLVEAGTGVGKSLAYLIPSLLYAKAHQRKAVFSTHTINLQEQLFLKDFPLVRKLLDEEVPVVLMKGRQNYLCSRRLERAMRHPGDLFVSSEVAELKRIWDWHLTTKDGTLSDFKLPPNPKVWAQVCSESHLCTPRTCGNNPRCFYQAARQQAVLAPAVIVNHSLFFSLISREPEEHLEEVGYLFANDFVVFDEAHTIENVASRHLGLSVSHGGIRYLLHRLYNPKTQKGLFQLMRRGDSVRSVVEALDTTDTFFQRLGEAAPFKQGNEIRITRPDVVEDLLSLPLAKLHRNLLDCADQCEDEDQTSELQESARRVASLRCEIGTFLSQSEDDHVYWVERTGKTGNDLQLQASPIDVAPHLQKMLFRPDHTAIFTSATLSVGKGLSYFQKRIGGLEARSLQLASPFNYPEQMKVYVPKQMPEPSDTEAYEAALARWIKYFVKMTDGKALVLFTSHRTLQHLTAELRPFFNQRRTTLLSQADPTPRHLLLKEFKEDTQSVLFGTDSFWQGVDVPGESLSNVIITRLPFAVPDHPLIQSKLEHIQTQGGDPFREYSLPEAILKFRQGIGRLIRTAEDKGIVAILDNRILTKAYGKAFFAVLPECPVEIVKDPERPTSFRG